MNIENWYDIGCNICGRHWSTDFGHGFERRKTGLSTKARKEGWKFQDGKNICPICAEEIGERIKMKQIPKKYMFKGSYENGGRRTISSIGIELQKKMLEELECPCCGAKTLRIKDYGWDSMFPEYQVGCDSCDWDSPTGTITDYGEAPCEFKRWLEAFELLGRPAEKVNEDLTLYFYPEGEWREKERLERVSDKE